MKVVDHGKAERKRNRGIIFSLLAVSAGITAYVVKNAWSKDKDFKKENSAVVDSPEMFYYDY